MNIHSAARLLTVSAFAILGAAFATAPATAADSHSHDAAPAVLKLNDGARWQTDAALRTGMESIRGAVAQWSKTLANELGLFQITVNNVLPGATETDRLAAIIHNKAVKGGISDAEAAHEMMVEVPLRRFARPAEIAAAVAFLAGPSAAYINGINLPVDGGRTGSL